MSPDELYRAGNRLFQAHWQSSLADLLGVNVRTMRRWVRGEMEIPEAVASAVCRLLEVRARADAARSRVPEEEMEG